MQEVAFKRNGVRTRGLFKPCGFNSTGRTIDLNRFARLKPTALCSPVVKSMFEDFSRSVQLVKPFGIPPINPALGFSTPSFPAPGNFLTGAAVWEA